MTLAVKMPSLYVNELAPPVLSEIWRMDWIPTPFPFRLAD